MKSESAKLGKNLKRIRTEKSITQGDIVRNLGVSRSFISNIENGKENFWFWFRRFIFSLLTLVL